MNKKEKQYRVHFCNCQCLETIKLCRFIVTNVSNGSINGIETKQIPNGDSPTTEDEDIRQLESDLPLVGDYIGIGGPDAVPLESPGAFEKPEKVADSLLDDLFMSPTDIQLITRRRTLLNAEM